VIETNQSGHKVSFWSRRPILIVIQLRDFYSCLSLLSGMDKNKIKLEFGESSLDANRFLELARLRPYLMRVAYHKIRDPSLAEDVVQETLLEAYLALPSFRGESSIQTWVVGILQNKAFKAFAKESRFVRLGELEASSLQETPDEEGSPTYDPMHIVLHRQEIQRLAASIDQLPKGLQDTVRLHFIDGQDIDSVCDELGISETNFWVRIHRVRKRLREL
jgi:RNA polymerase sigma factor (sigma-70 family)